MELNTQERKFSTGRTSANGVTYAIAITGFYPIVALDKEYKKKDNFQEVGFEYLKSEKITELDKYIDSNLRSQQLERVRFNRAITLCFILKNGKAHASKKQGVITAKSAGIKIISDNKDKAKEIKVLDEKRLEYQISYNRMDYGERILIKFSVENMQDIANISFYTNNQLCGKVQLERATTKSYYSISMMKETNYRAEMLRLFYKNKNVIEVKSNGLGFTVDELAASLTKNSVQKPNKDNYVAQEQISFLALFSHGIEGRIGGDTKWFGKEDLEKFQKYIDNGSLLFSKECIIFLGACNAGTGKKSSFAQKFADITNARVYAMADDGVAPVKEIKTEMVFGPKGGRNSKGCFYKFTKDKAPIKINKYIDILKLIKEAG